MCLNPHVVGRFFRALLKELVNLVYCLNPHVVGRFFREQHFEERPHCDVVLIPMWWGGFSEKRFLMHGLRLPSLNPHVVGRFFRVKADAEVRMEYISLNPHVVGRFFRAITQYIGKGEKLCLNPHVVGRFFRANVLSTMYPVALS